MKTCKNWYYKYQTKKQCEEAMEMEKINAGVSVIEETTSGTEETTSGTEETTSGTEETTTGDMVWAKTTALSDDADWVTDFDIEDEASVTPYKPELTTAEMTSLTTQEVKKEDILDVQIETPNVQVKFKRRRGVDGEVMTIVVFSEIGAVAFISFILYYGFKLFGNWWNQDRGENYNLRQAERSHLPLHQHQGENPEDTIRPRIQEDEGSEEGNDTPVGYSTAIENTQLTNTTRLEFSPIGPFPNRTVSMVGLDTDQRPSNLEKRSNSGPIPMNIDDEIEDQIPDLEGSMLLQQPPLPTVDAIIQNQPSGSDGSETGRRYPVRNRRSPVRFGNWVSQ